MLCACVLMNDPKWDKHLPLAEFSYNNSYKESIKMSPFEALYRRPCRTSLSWSESDERVIFGLDIVTEAEEKVKQIQANILAAQSRQKSYTDRRSLLEFEVGWSRVPSSLPNERCTPLRYQRKASSPLHWSVSYHWQVWANVLSSGVISEASGVHYVFHVSQLKRCLKPPTDVVIKDTIPLEPDLTYKPYPIKIPDQ
jgi:hypothetical protein